MFVLEVEIEGHRYDESRQTHFARVVFRSEASNATISCALRMAENVEPTTLARAFVSDAVRQISRLPAYDSAESKVSFAPNALRTASGFAA